MLFRSANFPTRPKASGQKSPKRLQDFVIPSNPCAGACSSVVEHLTFNQRVIGSIPTGLTSYFKGLVNQRNFALVLADVGYSPL